MGLAYLGHIVAVLQCALQVGDDSLLYAMARSDNIPALSPFKGHCKPTWLFLASGQPVAVMHGANAPLMKIMVAEEMEKERKVQAGELSRRTITLEEAVPGRYAFLETVADDIFAVNELEEEQNSGNKNPEWLKEMKAKSEKKAEEKIDDPGNKDSTSICNEEAPVEIVEENKDKSDGSDEAGEYRLLLLNSQLAGDLEKIETLKTELTNKG